MSDPHPSPFPTALVLDTSFLRTIGGTGSDAYETFVQYVRTEGRELYLSRGVVQELTEQRGYISVDWVDRADTTEWITLVGDVQPGVRVHDGPRAGEIMTGFTTGWRRSNRLTQTSYGRQTQNCLLSV